MLSSCRSVRPSRPPSIKLTSRRSNNRRFVFQVFEIFARRTCSHHALLRVKPKRQDEKLAVHLKSLRSQWSRSNDRPSAHLRATQCARLRFQKGLRLSVRRTLASWWDSSSRSECRRSQLRVGHRFRLVPELIMRQLRKTQFQGFSRDIPLWALCARGGSSFTP